MSREKLATGTLARKELKVAQKHQGNLNFTMCSLSRNIWEVTRTRNRRIFPRVLQSFWMVTTDKLILGIESNFWPIIRYT